MAFTIHWTAGMAHGLAVSFDVNQPTSQIYVFYSFSHSWGISLSQSMEWNRIIERWKSIWTDINVKHNLCEYYVVFC